MRHPFRQVDVFTATAHLGNPVAVVLDAEELSTAAMQRLAAWTNLSETTFVLRPTRPDADYRVRIFTPAAELPFAGHPTLGTCHAWLAEGGSPADDLVVVQECGAGLVPIRRGPARLAFAAPPLVRSGSVDDALVDELVGGLGLDRRDLVDAQWVDNGPGWVALLLRDADAVLGVRPGAIRHDVGLVGPHPEGSPTAFEVRAFFPVDDVPREDPVTGSLNAALAQWLIASDRVTPPYVASQGTALGRAGRVHIDRDGDGVIWTGGDTIDVIVGTIEV
jgi:PhzF family phenazine biosynthesis protein